MAFRLARVPAKYASAEDILDLTDNSEPMVSTRKVSTESIPRTSSEDGSNRGSGIYSSHAMAKGGGSGSGLRWKKHGKLSKRRFGVVSPPPSNFFASRSESGVESAGDPFSPPATLPPSGTKFGKSKRLEWFLGPLSPTPQTPTALPRRPLSYEEDLEQRVLRLIAISTLWRDKWDYERKEKRVIKEERDVMITKVMSEYEESCCQYESLVDRLRERLDEMAHNKEQTQKAFRVVVNKLAKERSAAIQRAQRSEASLSLAYSEIQEVKIALAELQQSKINLQRTNESFLDQLHNVKEELKQVKTAARRDVDGRNHGIAHALYRLCELESSKADRALRETPKAKKGKLARRHSLEDERKAEMERNNVRLQSTVQSVLVVLNEHRISATDLFDDFLLAKEAESSPWLSKMGNTDNRDRDHVEDSVSSGRLVSVLADLVEEPVGASSKAEADRASSTASSVVDFYISQDSHENPQDRLDGWKTDVADSGSNEIDLDRGQIPCQAHPQISGNGDLFSKGTPKKRKGSKLKDVTVKGFAELFNRKRRGDRRHSHGNTIETDLETMSHISDVSKDTHLSDCSFIFSNLENIGSCKSLASLEPEGATGGEGLESGKTSHWKFPDPAKVTLVKTQSGAHLSDKHVNVSPEFSRRSHHPEHQNGVGHDRSPIRRRLERRSLSLASAENDLSVPYPEGGKSASRVLQWLKKKVKPSTVQRDVYPP